MSSPIQQILEKIEGDLNTEVLGEFRDLMSTTVQNKLDEVMKNYKGLSATIPGASDDEAAYQGSLEDAAETIQAVHELSHELSIIGLYRLVEERIKGMVKRNHRSLDQKQVYLIEYLKTNLPFKIADLSQFDALDELRLLNNAIKHDRFASKSLATINPVWTEGQPILGLDAAYVRLLPLIKEYVKDFARQSYANAEPRPPRPAP